MSAMVAASRARIEPRVSTAGLPSGESAQALVNGDVGAWPLVALHWGLRAVLIGSAIAVLTPVRGVLLLKSALAGSTGIEVFVLGWAALMGDKK